MPDLTVIGLTEKALVWAKTGTSGSGEPVLGSYTEYKARWNMHAGRAMDPKGNTIAIDGKVALGFDIPVDSIVWEGGEQDLINALAATGTAPTVPYTPTTGLLQAVTTARAKDIKGRTTRREYGLKRFNGTLPTISS